MSRWPEVRLGEVLHLCLDAEPVDPTAQYPIAGVYSFGRGLFKRESLSGSETTYKTFNRLHAGDLVISQLKAWEGAIALITPEFDGWYLSPQFATFRGQLDRVDIRYVNWYFKRAPMWEQLERGSRGMGARRNSVSPKQFLETEIPLPPIEEQRRVVRRIEQLATQLERAGTAAPVGYDMALVTSFLGSVFRGHLARFEQVPLGELCYFENGDRSANYPSKSVRTSTGVPFINAGHMVDDGIDMTSMDFIPRDRFDLLSNGKTKPGDILFCLRGSLGKCTCVGDLPEGAIASSLVIVRPGERVLGSYVLAFLRSPLCSELVDRFKNGAAQPNLSARSLKKFPVPVPPLEEQATVVRAVRRLQERAHCVELLGRWRRMAIDALHASLLEGALT